MTFKIERPRIRNASVATMQNYGRQQYEICIKLKKILDDYRQGRQNGQS